VRTSKNGSSFTELVGARAGRQRSAHSVPLHGDARRSDRRFAARWSWPPAAGRRASRTEITATIAPTGATSPSPTRISASTPSWSKHLHRGLVVSISNRLSPAYGVAGRFEPFRDLASATVSPAAASAHPWTVPRALT